MYIIRQIVVVICVATWCIGQQARAQDSNRRLEPAIALTALDAFKQALDERWSYRHANKVNIDAAIAALRDRIARPHPRASDRGILEYELGFQLQKILALGIDGHAAVSGFSVPAGGRLPFLIEVAGKRYVAVDSQRKAFLADGFPFITKIDDRSVDDWCAVVSVVVMKGSPQYIRHRCLNRLRELDYWRLVMNLPRTQTVDIELTDRDGKARKRLRVPLGTSLVSYGTWPATGSRLLDGNIGYLRLTTMVASDSVTEIETWMPKFRNTAGLIVDVRDNNGGDRDPLLVLYSYLITPNDPPRVFNAAAYRLYKDRPENYLANNHRMFRADSAEWTTEERKAVAEFARRFKPKWELPPGQFSDWHYMALSHEKVANVYHFDKPVIVLLNGKSFSATDIFLAGLKGMKNVLLMGSASSGGSAFTQEIPLGETNLRLRIGSMASFQSDGSLFDGNGVHPDVLVDPIPEFFIGGRDNVLEEAVKRIMEWRN